MGSYNSELDELKDLAEAQGWRIESGGSDHWKFVGPDGRLKVTASRTPSDVNAIRIVRRELVSSGLKIPDVREVLMEKRAEKKKRKSIQPLVRDYVAGRNGAEVTTAEIIDYCKMKLGGEVNSGSISVALGALAEQNKVIQLHRGIYRWRVERTSSAPAAPATPKPEINLAGFAKDTEDERILNASLAALGKIESRVREILNEAISELGQIESVVRKNRDVARLLVELKEKWK